MQKAISILMMIGLTQSVQAKWDVSTGELQVTAAGVDAPVRASVDSKVSSSMVESQQSWVLPQGSTYETPNSLRGDSSPNFRPPPQIVIPVPPPFPENC